MNDRKVVTGLLYNQNWRVLIQGCCTDRFLKGKIHLIQGEEHQGSAQPMMGDLDLRTQNTHTQFVFNGVIAHTISCESQKRKGQNSARQPIRPLTALVCPRKCSQAGWQHDIHLSTPGQSYESHQVRQSSP